MISVRSYLTAGTAAVVGASAIALSPVAPGSGPAPIDLPVPAPAAVALTGVTLPLTDVIGVLQTLGGLGGSLTEVLGGFLPQQFINDIVAEVLNQATPVLTTAAGEVVGYLGTALTGLLIGPDSIPARVGAALVDVPVVLASAVEALSIGDIASAVETATTGLSAPLTEVGQTIADAGQAFQEFLVGKLNETVGALPGILFAAIEAVFGDTFQTSLDTVTDALSGLFGGLLPAADSVDVPAAAAVVVAGSETFAVRSAVPSPDPVAAEVKSPAPVTPRAAAAEPSGPTAVAQEVSPTPVTVPAETVTPVSRPRLAASAHDLTESAASAAATVTGPGSAVRGTRASAGKPTAAGSTRAGRKAE